MKPILATALTLFFAFVAVHAQTQLIIPSNEEEAKGVIETYGRAALEKARIQCRVLIMNALETMPTDQAKQLQSDEAALGTLLEGKDNRNIETITNAFLENKLAESGITKTIDALAAAKVEKVKERIQTIRAGNQK